MPSFALAQTDTGWEIRQFDSVITGEKTGRLTVQETITVHFEEPHRGIFRDIPVVYRDEMNNRVKITVHLTDVQQDGVSAVHETSLSGGELAIRIGSPSVMISGEHVYRISYTVDRALLYFDDHDEIYWNVTGSDWAVPIQATTAVVQLPDGTEITSADCYVERQGADGEETCGIAKEAGTVAFASEGPMTIAVGFPKGVVPEPTFWDRMGLFLKDNWTVVIPLLIASVVVWIWWKRGRDPKESTFIAEYDPPEGMSAVTAGAFLQQYVTKQHLVAMIIQMAVWGHLLIDSQTTEEGIFKTKRMNVTLKKQTSGAGLDRAHKLLFEALFKDGKESVSLHDIKGTLPESMLREIRQEVLNDLEQRGYFTTNSFTWRVACFVLAGILWFCGIFLAGNFGSAFGVSAFVSGLVIAFFGWFMPQRTLLGAEMHRRVKGFKLFMHTAERYRSAWQEREGIFATFLPYAIAFNDVKQWAKTFEGLEQQNPSWYHSNLAFVSATHFADDVLGTSQLMGTALTPQGSGAGGGGSVGGGFGGGGGGAW